MNKTVSNFLVGFLAGAAIGAVAGILFAPEKGDKTRQNLRKKVKELSDEYGLGLDELIEEMSANVEPESKPKKRKYTRKTK